jgi:hypothetical protein
MYCNIIYYYYYYYYYNEQQNKGGNNINNSSVCHMEQKNSAKTESGCRKWLERSVNYMKSECTFNFSRIFTYRTEHRTSSCHAFFAAICCFSSLAPFRPLIFRINPPSSRAHLLEIIRKNNFFGFYESFILFTKLAIFNCDSVFFLCIFVCRDFLVHNLDFFNYFVILVISFCEFNTILMVRFFKNSIQPKM